MIVIIALSCLTLLSTSVSANLAISSPSAVHPNVVSGVSISDKIISDGSKKQISQETDGDELSLEGPSRSIFSTEELQSLNDYVKRLSHMKGPFIKQDGKMATEYEDGVEVRRSIIRKASFKSESEIVKELLHKLKSATSNKLIVLEDIEYLVHQYDVAINFAKMNGLNHTLQFLSSKDNGIFRAALSVLSAAMQGNPVVQKYAVKENVGHYLFLLLNESSLSLSSVITAISSYVRNMPEAQKQLSDSDIILRFKEILLNYRIPTNTKLKIITLLADIADEFMEVKIAASGFSHLLDYQKLFLSKVEEHICEHVPSFLEYEDYDSHERIVSAMESLFFICSRQFNTSQSNERVMRLIEIYRPPQSFFKPMFYPHLDDEVNDALYVRLVHLYKSLTDKYYDNSLIQNPALQSKDEL